VARTATSYVCQECGAAQPKWSGRCDACGGWNTLVEEMVAGGPPKGLGGKRGRKVAFSPLDGEIVPVVRRTTGIGEFDRVTGGGLVPGSALLIGGDPGIGKSTLLLQVVAALAGAARTAYISGEEAIDQLKLRADRLGLRGAPVALATATSVRDIASSLDAAGAADVVVVDSVQTLYLDTLESAPRHGRAGAGVGPGADPPRQAARLRPVSRRPRDQGRDDRRPPGARAHGRHRPLLRG
jgi:DNA repair protein RadA/Sms